VAVTARHYARWIEDDHYREPMRIEPGEVPADLLARLRVESDPRVTPLGKTAESGGDAKPSAALRKVGGAEGDRTPDPQTASLMLSQLSYSPTVSGSYRRASELSKREMRSKLGPPGDGS
jgi:hypothetical protein